MKNQAAAPEILDVAAIRAALEQRTEIPNEIFDRLYPATHRYRSGRHWTPVDVALLVSDWLALPPGAAILDVGAGVGKACHVGALATQATWSGIERVPTMVRIANRIARALGIEARAKFLQGEALELDWSSFDAVYLFNPFNEAVLALRPTDPAVRQAAYIHEVLSVERKLMTLRPGARVVTYHGFGGEMPPAFELVEKLPAYGDFLSLWIHRS